jgi:hypothetical protein
MTTYLAVLRTVTDKKHFGIVIDGCEAEDEEAALKILKDVLYADGVSLCEVKPCWWD